MADSYDPTYEQTPAQGSTAATPGEPAPVEPPKPPTSPKVTAASLASLAAGIALALVMALTGPEGQATMSGLPPVLQFLLLAAAPAVVTFLAGFITPNSEAYLTPALRAVRARKER